MDSSTIMSFLIGISLSLIALITTIGNIIVLLAFYCDRKLRTINDYFILNMAVADFLVGVFCIPFYIPFSLTQSWPFGRLFCKIWVTVDDVATMASVINIVAISVNRYWSIAYPISYRKYARQDFVYIVMASVWCLSFINFAPGIWLLSLFDHNLKNRNDCSGDYNQSFVYMLIAQFNYFTWPFIVLCILNILIMLNIWKRTRKMSRMMSFKVPKKNREKYDHSTKIEIENNKELSPNKCNTYETKNSPTIDNKNTNLIVLNSPISNHRQIFTEKMKSSSNCQDTMTCMSSINEHYSPIIPTRKQSIKKINSLRPPVKQNVNSPKVRHSSPTIALAKRSLNVNHRISRNYRSDSVVEYHAQKEIEIIENKIKQTRQIAGRDLRIIRDRKAARSLFILVLVFLIFLFPYVICATASTAGFQIPATLFEISFWLLWLNSTCNPFLYPFIQIKYRRAYAKLFQSCFRHPTFK